MHHCKNATVCRAFTLATLYLLSIRRQCALSQTGFELGQFFLYPMLITELLPPSGANTTICSGKRGGLLQQQISYILESFLTPSRKRFARLILVLEKLNYMYIKILKRIFIILLLSPL